MGVTSKDCFCLVLCGSRLPGLWMRLWVFMSSVTHTNMTFLVQITCSTPAHTHTAKEESSSSGDTYSLEVDNMVELPGLTLCMIISLSTWS